MGERLIVIGGCAAGMSAAAKARRLNPEFEIVVYEKTGFISYAECGLPYYVAGVIDDHRKLIVRTPEQFAQQEIKVYLHHEVTEIDLANRSVRVADLDSGEEFTTHYDKLLIATGGSRRGNSRASSPCGRWRTGSPSAGSSGRRGQSGR